MSRAIVWFRDDLRVHDNEALYLAAQNHDEIIPFFCFDSRFFGNGSFGFEKTGEHRAQFLIESIHSLKKQLRKLGSDLYLCYGNTSANLIKIADEFQVDQIYCNKSIHEEENQIQHEVETQLDCPIKYVYGSTLIHPGDLGFNPKETPRSFSSFRKKVESNLCIRKEIPYPQKLPPFPKNLISDYDPSLENLGVSMNYYKKENAIANGGEEEGLKRLKYYFFESEKILEYKETRNGLLGFDYSSKLSLWLWNGALSPRKIYWELKRFEQSVKSNQSTYWLLFELLWRDFYKFTAIKEGNQIFKIKGVQNRKREWKNDQTLFQQWADGLTGVPFIDANMKELNQTGFMSNRGRQNVASFFVVELGLDWRMGAAYFESKLIDYDVASNYGNWMYIAGVGNDSRDRYFNIISQAKRYDPKGEYVKHWLPELADCSSEIVHHPWTAQKTLFDRENVGFPRPIAEPDYWKQHY